MVYRRFKKGFIPRKFHKLNYKVFLFLIQLYSIDIEGDKLEKKIVHIEIPIKKLERAKKFYESVFDWKVELETGMPGYAFFKSGETGVEGGFEVREKVAKGEIMLHIQTDDIHKTLKNIAKFGGKTIKEKTDIGNDFGFYAIFEDSEGNHMGIWSEK